MKLNYESSPIPLRRIQVTDIFWKREMELVRTEVIPYQWEALNNRIEDAEKSYCMHNFQVAGKISKQREELGDAYEEIKHPLNFTNWPKEGEEPGEEFYGFLFQDSDFFKWIEAVGYSLIQHPNEELEKVADQAIEVVCKAQHSSGYLDTYYIINDMDKIFTNLQNNHELYCFGHMVEGAIAYYEATGKDKLLHAAERYGEFISSRFGIGEDQIKGYPGHQIAEMALVRLYEITGNKKYLELSEFFLYQRGQQPYYFQEENHDEIKSADGIWYHYYQAHLPVLEQKEAVGHAVRAVYMYSGMADVARITENDRLFQVCEDLWNSIVNEKMYITGGIGATHMGEAFSYPYDLPNDRAYSETCASIGLVFFARRMLQIAPHHKYADVMEMALYNGVLSGMALDGKSFFYVNPLEVLPEACEKDERIEHVKPVRQKWFGCACCPPNLARIISSIGLYGLTENAKTVFVHLYMGCEWKKEVDGILVSLVLTSSFPWEGAVSIAVTPEKPVEMTMALRIPGWCQNYQLAPVEGVVIEKDGYLYITKKWEKNDVISIDFDMPIKRIRSNPKVRQNLHKVAIQKGPIVYCLEEVDNGSNLALLSLPKNSSLGFFMDEIQDNPVGTIHGRGMRVKVEPEFEKVLYCEEFSVEEEKVSLKWIPYYAWANRGKNEMMVWITEE